MSTVVIQKIGMDAGIILGKPDLVALGADIGDELIVSQTGDGEITIKRVDSDVAETLKAAREGMLRYRDTLRALPDKDNDS